MPGGCKGSDEYVLAVVRGDGDLTLAPIVVMKKFIQVGDIRGIFTTEEKTPRQQNGRLPAAGGTT